ncbi:MAG: glycosyltransferase family 2 protein [Verrucomicrobia bacterium]|nr:glycosyltransferase family 2 protein [Verrucomicrobiota bacterium]
MKFSVLLPTRNRLEYLKYAIDSVLHQDYQNWEIIVSDNHSEENIKQHIDQLNDNRIKYFRTDSFIPVTANWNNAMDKSMGDYVIMLGDDDCLMKNYFTTMVALLSKFPNPDFVYTGTFLFAYPNVLPWRPKGLLQKFGNASFLKDKKEPFWLSKEESILLVKEAFNFKIMFNYNIQFSLISRHFIEELKTTGSFFNSPYPDYYATIVMMLKGKKILACPAPLVTIGICPKSFGYYYFSNSEKKGTHTLNNSSDKTSLSSLQKILLPGTDMNDCWLSSLACVKEKFPLSGLKINTSRYRLLQIIQTFQLHTLGKESNIQNIKALWSKLSWREKLTTGLFFRCAYSLIKPFPYRIREKLAHLLAYLGGSNPRHGSINIEGPYENISQVFHTIDPSNFI